MGKYAWTALIWAVFGIIGMSIINISSNQTACIAPNAGEVPTFFSLVWIIILGGLLIADMLSWGDKNGRDRTRRKASRLER